MSIVTDLQKASLKRLKDVFCTRYMDVSEMFLNEHRAFFIYRNRVVFVYVGVTRTCKKDFKILFFKKLLKKAVFVMI